MITSSFVTRNHSQANYASEYIVPNSKNSLPSAHAAKSFGLLRTTKTKIASSN
jgi:hypothetical protein